jgi:hypothetical protein
MARYLVWAATSALGSRVEKAIEIDDAGIDGKENAEIWDAYLLDVFRQLVEGGFERVHTRYCTNCVYWEILNDDANDVLEALCTKLGGPYFDEHVKAMDSCDQFEYRNDDQNAKFMPNKR